MVNYKSVWKNSFRFRVSKAKVKSLTTLRLRSGQATDTKEDKGAVSSFQFQKQGRFSLKLSILPSPHKKQLQVASSKLQGPRRLTSMPRTYLFALLVVLLSSALAFAQFRTVTVQNANGNPVPTTIQNTPTVNVSGTVPVTVGNTPTVNVNGTVPVTVSNT